MFKLFKYLSAVILVIGCAVAYTQYADAASAQEIDNGINIQLDNLKKIHGAEDMLKKSKGALIFPAVFQGGIGIGGAYGEGALRINNRTVDYYNMITGSIGFQLGGEKKTVVFLFMTDKALKDFRNASGWKAGVDASVALVELGAGTSIDSQVANKPIVVFAFGRKGLMYNLVVEGAKITKIKK